MTSIWYVGVYEWYIPTYRYIFQICFHFNLESPSFALYYVTTGAEDHEETVSDCVSYTSSKDADKKPKDIYNRLILYLAQ